MSDPRPYATLLAKGEDRRQRIIAVAQRLLTRNGWRSTTLGQIAKEAGVSPAGLLHHFESKEQLLHALLDARDAFDLAHWQSEGDIISQLDHVAERFRLAPEMVGLFAVLRMENLDPDAPLHDRFFARQRVAVDTVAEAIRKGQADGRYRTDLDPVLKAVEIIAFLNGIETSWLLDPSTPLDEVFRDYTDSLARQLASPADAS